MIPGGIYHDPGRHIPDAPLLRIHLFVFLELFEDPSVFNPERYLNSEFGVKEGANVNGLRDNLPFGAGRVSVALVLLLQVANRLPARSLACLPWRRNGLQDNCEIDTIGCALTLLISISLGHERDESYMGIQFRERRVRDL